MRLSPSLKSTGGPRRRKRGLVASARRRGARFLLQSRSEIYAAWRDVARTGRSSSVSQSVSQSSRLSVARLQVWSLGLTVASGQRRALGTRMSLARLGESSPVVYAHRLLRHKLLITPIPSSTFAAKFLSLACLFRGTLLLRSLPLRLTERSPALGLPLWWGRKIYSSIYYVCQKQCAGRGRQVREMREMRKTQEQNAEVAARRTGRDAMAASRWPDASARNRPAGARRPAVSRPSLRARELTSCPDGRRATMTNRAAIDSTFASSHISRAGG